MFKNFKSICEKSILLCPLNHRNVPQYLFKEKCFKLICHFSDSWMMKFHVSVWGLLKGKIHILHVFPAFAHKIYLFQQLNASQLISQLKMKFTLDLKVINNQICCIFNCGLQNEHYNSPTQYRKRKMRWEFWGFFAPLANF